MVKVCAVGDLHGNVKKVSGAPKNVDMYLLTGDLGKADLARKFCFDNIKRRKSGLSEKEMDSSMSKKLHDEIHNSTLNVLKRFPKSSNVYTLQGNVGIPGSTECKKRDKKHGVKHLSTLDALKKIKNVSLVKNRLRVINGLRVGFLEYFVDTCWVREFKPSDYKKRMKNAKKEAEGFEAFWKN
jgi:Icc-related predicted phosphoesterase